MSLRSRNKISAEFSMSSMTDIVFLLLIFFMLTSNFVTPSALNVNLPTSKVANIQMQKVNVSISEDLRYSINDKLVSRNELERELKNILAKMPKEERLVVLHIDKSVPTEHFVEVASIATILEAKVSIATKPK